MTVWLHRTYLVYFIEGEECQDMIMVYKIVHGLDGIHFEAIFTNFDTITRSNGYNLFKHHSLLNIRKYSFSQRLEQITSRYCRSN